LTAVGIDVGGDERRVEVVVGVVEDGGFVLGAGAASAHALGGVREVLEAGGADDARLQVGGADDRRRQVGGGGARWVPPGLHENRLVALRVGGAGGSGDEEAVVVGGPDVGDVARGRRPRGQAPGAVGVAAVGDAWQAGAGGGAVVAAHHHVAEAVDGDGVEV